MFGYLVTVDLTLRPSAVFIIVIGQLHGQTTSLKGLRGKRNCPIANEARREAEG